MSMSAPVCIVGPVYSIYGDIAASRSTVGICNIVVYNIELAMEYIILYYAIIKLRLTANSKPKSLEAKWKYKGQGKSEVATIEFAVVVVAYDVVDVKGVAFFFSSEIGGDLLVDRE